MQLLLAVLIVSFLTISLLLVPFINFLYKIKFQRQKQITKDIFEVKTPIFDRLHSWKTGTPVGGGFLVIFVVSVLSFMLLSFRLFTGAKISSVYPLEKEIFILFFTFLAFGILGLYDDLRKTFKLAKHDFWGLRFRYKFLIQWVLAGLIASFLYFPWGLNIHIINIRFLDVFDVGILFIPFAAFVIVAFANAVNITDGLDGLASGLLLICFFAFLPIAQQFLDTPLSVFIGLWIGAMLGFLYFNIYPARIWLGDVGTMSFGATLALIGLLLGKTLGLTIIGSIFVIEAASSLLQLLSKKFRKKKLFEVAPLHLYFQNKGWEEPKIVMRFWLAGVLAAIIGLLLALPR
jgi:phospho-N-acetylmuramoyl-pentapeptide-transferase